MDLLRISIVDELKSKTEKRNKERLASKDRTDGHFRVVNPFSELVPSVKIHLVAQSLPRLVIVCVGITQVFVVQPLGCGKSVSGAFHWIFILTALPFICKLNPFPPPSF